MSRPSTERITGRIIYRNRGVETGREWFDITRHGASQTLRAFCEMDEFGLVRDVSVLLDAESRPIDGFVRLTVNGTPRASSIFFVSGTGVECSARIDGITTRQHLPEMAAADYLGLHPLVCDALIAARRGTASPDMFVTIAGVTNSLGPNGDEGMLATRCTIDVAYLGDEEIEVTAGRFAAHRYAVRWRQEWPAANLWVIQGTSIFLRLTWSMIDAEYELIELDCDQSVSGSPRFSRI